MDVVSNWPVVVTELICRLTGNEAPQNGTTITNNRSNSSIVSCKALCVLHICTQEAVGEMPKSCLFALLTGRIQVLRAMTVGWHRIQSSHRAVIPALLNLREEVEEAHEHNSVDATRPVVFQSIFCGHQEGF